MAACHGGWFFNADRYVDFGNVCALLRHDPCELNQPTCREFGKCQLSIFHLNAGDLLDDRSDRKVNRKRLLWWRINVPNTLVGLVSLGPAIDASNFGVESHASFFVADQKTSFLSNTLRVRQVNNN